MYIIITQLLKTKVNKKIKSFKNNYKNDELLFFNII
jgi:hypothetical protein